ncbi:MAG: type II secretion system major pseudopilin GspG [Planctomycetota bacterium]|jgi:general secretion pathway protein G
MMKRSRARRNAFTLVEVLLVIGLLVFLGTVSVVAYTRIQASADKDSARLLVNQTAEAVNLYQVTMRKLPESDEGLQALVTKPSDEREAERWDGPYLKNARIPVDPWGNELKYERLDTSGEGPPFRVFSYGPDGREGSEDDISSVKE